MPSVADFFERHLRALMNMPLLDGYAALLESRGAADAETREAIWD